MRKGDKEKQGGNKPEVLLCSAKPGSGKALAPAPRASTPQDSFMGLGCQAPF